MQSNDTNGSRLTLEQLAESVARDLAARRLVEQVPDGRVSAVPDARTIRYYTTLGLVDRPVIVDRQARYGDRHRLQLVAIKALQGAGLPLAEIQRRVYARSNTELEAMVSSLARIPEPTGRRPTATRWFELTLEPGIRLMVEESRLGSGLPADLDARIRAAVTSLAQEIPSPKEQQ